MKKSYKSIIGLVLSLIMIFAICVPAFAQGAELDQKNSSSDFITSIEKDIRGEHAEGEILTIVAKVKNGANEPRDILVKVRTSAFAKVLTINGEKTFKNNIELKNVQPGEEKLITVELRVERTALAKWHQPANYLLGEFTTVLFRFVDTLSLNVVTDTFRFGEDSAAAILFKAEDITNK